MEAPIGTTLQPGSALLIGREPDPSRIDWSALVPQQAPCALLSPCTEPARYRMETLAIKSGRTSANHLLVLCDGAVTALYDLGSRNGSWIRLGPRRPVIMAAGIEVSVSLAGASASEPSLQRPRDAEWTEESGFGPAVVRALSDWIEQNDIPLHVQRSESASAGDSILLADDSAIELSEYGTLQVSKAQIYEVICEYIHDQNARYMQIAGRVSGMVAASAAIRRVLIRTAEAAAHGRRTILLGPTGVGKELLARSYHLYSPRHAGPFVTVNCALLEKDLLYAQLFGARRGSFTGAATDVPGLVEAAAGGTLFLDELGEMSPDVQKALLRFLDSRGEYYRLGDARARRADIQIVCASNVPLNDPTYRSGRFRDDLWYRLAASVIVVPPLHERPEDIRAFLYSRRLPGTNLRVAESMTQDALDALLRDPWPGNFRDLENFIDRLPAVSSPLGIDRTLCEQALQEGRPDQGASQPPSARLTVAVPDTAPATGTGAAPGQAAVSTEAARLKAAPSRAGSRLHGDPLLQKNASFGWERILERAIKAFLEDQEEELAGWNQLQLLVERYVKPMYVAHAASLSDTPATARRAVNYSALARRLHIADGTTVKTHLQRFEERFFRAADDTGGRLRNIT